MSSEMPLSAVTLGEGHPDSLAVNYKAAEEKSCSFYFVVQRSSSKEETYQIKFTTVV